MKIRIGPYRSWFGPHQLAEALCFWARDVPDELGMPRKPNWVHDFGEWLAYGSVEPTPLVGEVRPWDHERKPTLVHRFLLWIDSHKQRRIQVRIDPWDTWSMDHTLALIVLPMLRQLQETKHGAPCVDDEDVPEHLRSTAAPNLTQEQQDTGGVDDNHFARWDWALDEMIWAFQQHLDENSDTQFWSGQADHQWKQLEGGMSQMVEGPRHTLHLDRDALQAWQQRKDRGFRLFGKYYQALWN